MTRRYAHLCPSTGCYRPRVGHYLCDVCMASLPAELREALEPHGRRPPGELGERAGQMAYLARRKTNEH